MPEQVDYFICMRVGRPGYVTPGSVALICSKCGSAVWIAPSSLEIRRQHPESRILCEECSFSQIEEQGGVFAGLTPAQQREIDEWRARGGQRHA